MWELKVSALAFKWRLELLMVLVEARSCSRRLLHDAAVLRAALASMLMRKD